MGRSIVLDEGNVRQGLLGLVMALVEIIHEALRLQALRRMESGDLTTEELDRLGRTLQALADEIVAFKREQGIEDAVQSVRQGLDELATDVLNTLLDPFRWDDRADER